MTQSSCDDFEANFVFSLSSVFFKLWTLSLKQFILSVQYSIMELRQLQLNQGQSEDCKVNMYLMTYLILKHMSCIIDSFCSLSVSVGLENSGNLTLVLVNEQQNLLILVFFFLIFLFPFQHLVLLSKTLHTILIVLLLLLLLNILCLCVCVWHNASHPMKYYLLRMLQAVPLWIVLVIEPDPPLWVQCCFECNRIWSIMKVVWKPVVWCFFDGFCCFFVVFWSSKLRKNHHQRGFC